VPPNAFVVCNGTPLATSKQIPFCVRRNWAIRWKFSFNIIGILSDIRAVSLTTQRVPAWWTVYEGVCSSIQYCIRIYLAYILFCCSQLFACCSLQLFKNFHNKLKLSYYTPWRRLEGEMCSYSFSTSALYGGMWSESRPGRALAPVKGPPVPIVQEAGWASEPVWTQATGNIPSPLPGFEPQSPGRPARSQTLYW
jgi:hypothetical protein